MLNEEKINELEKTLTTLEIYVQSDLDVMVDSFVLETSYDTKEKDTKIFIKIDYSDKECSYYDLETGRILEKRELIHTNENAGKSYFEIGFDSENWHQIRVEKKVDKIVKITDFIYENKDSVKLDLSDETKENLIEAKKEFNEAFKNTTVDERAKLEFMVNENFLTQEKMLDQLKIEQPKEHILVEKQSNFKYYRNVGGKFLEPEDNKAFEKTGRPFMNKDFEYRPKETELPDRVRLFEEKYQKLNIKTKMELYCSDNFKDEVKRFVKENKINNIETLDENYDKRSISPDIEKIDKDELNDKEWSGFSEEDFYGEDDCDEEKSLDFDDVDDDYYDYNDLY